MPISEAHVGRSYPPGDKYEVSVAKITEFADALSDPDPAYRGTDPMAPPTFVAAIAAAAWTGMFEDPELGLALRRIVHVDQRFDYSRPLRAGDVVTAQLTLEKVRVRGSVDIVGCAVSVETITGEAVCTARSTFYHSHESEDVHE